jgi:hypothetical protein
MKLSSCGLEVADFRKNCDCGIAELLLRINTAFKSCGIAIAEVLSSSCGIPIADFKKSCACPALVIRQIRIRFHRRSKVNINYFQDGLNKIDVNTMNGQRQSIFLKSLTVRKS